MELLSRPAAAETVPVTARVNAVAADALSPSPMTRLKAKPPMAITSRIPPAAVAAADADPVAEVADSARAKMPLKRPPASKESEVGK